MRNQSRGQHVNVDFTSKENDTAVFCPRHMKKGAEKIKDQGFDQTVKPDFQPKIDIRLQHKPA